MRLDRDLARRADEMHRRASQEMAACRCARTGAWDEERVSAVRERHGDYLRALGRTLAEDMGNALEGVPPFSPWMMADQPRGNWAWGVRDAKGNPALRRPDGGLFFWSRLEAEALVMGCGHEPGPPVFGGFPGGEDALLQGRAAREGEWPAPTSMETEMTARRLAALRTMGLNPESPRERAERLSRMAADLKGKMRPLVLAMQACRDAGSGKWDEARVAVVTREHGVVLGKFGAYLSEFVGLDGEAPFSPWMLHRDTSSDGPWGVRGAGGNNAVRAPGGSPFLGSRLEAEALIRAHGHEPGAPRFG